MVPLAIGTQTTGSTTRPASFCGVFGYRPTWGDLRMTHVMESSGSLDTLGILARSIEDDARYRDVLLGVESVPIPDNVPVPRIGFCRTHVWPRLEPATQRLLEDAAQRLARAGATVEEVTLPADFEGLEAAHRWITGFEFARNFTWEIENRWGELSETLRNGRLKDGLACSYEDYAGMRELVARCRHLLAPIMGNYDILLAASAAGEAPLGLNSTVHPWVYMIWTTMHVPSVTLPVFKGPHGMPIGAQLIARRSDDRRLFAAARWIYQRLPSGGRRVCRLNRHGAAIPIAPFGDFGRRGAELSGVLPGFGVEGKALFDVRINRIFTSSELSLSTIALGVPAGTSTPFHVSAA